MDSASSPKRSVFSKVDMMKEILQDERDYDKLQALQQTSTDFLSVNRIQDADFWEKVGENELGLEEGQDLDEFVSEWETLLDQQKANDKKGKYDQAIKVKIQGNKRKVGKLFRSVYYENKYKLFPFVERLFEETKKIDINLNTELVNCVSRLLDVTKFGTKAGQIAPLSEITAKRFQLLFSYFHARLNKGESFVRLVNKLVKSHGGLSQEATIFLIDNLLKDVKYYRGLFFAVFVWKKIDVERYPIDYNHYTFQNIASRQNLFNDANYLKSYMAKHPQSIYHILELLISARYQAYWGKYFTDDEFLDLVFSLHRSVYNFYYAPEFAKHFSKYKKQYPELARRLKSYRGVLPPSKSGQVCAKAFGMDTGDLPEPKIYHRELTGRKAEELLYTLIHDPYSVNMRKLKLKNGDGQTYVRRNNNGVISTFSLFRGDRPRGGIFDSEQSREYKGNPLAEYTRESFFNGDISEYSIFTSSSKKNFYKGKEYESVRAAEYAYREDVGKYNAVFIEEDNDKLGIESSSESSSSDDDEKPQKAGKKNNSESSSSSEDSDNSKTPPRYRGRPGKRPVSPSSSSEEINSPIRSPIASPIRGIPPSSPNQRLINSPARKRLTFDSSSESSEEVNNSPVRRIPKRKNVVSDSSSESTDSD